MCVKFIVLFVVSKRLCYIVTCLAIIKQDVTCLAIIKQDVTCLAIMFILEFRSLKQDHNYSTTARADSVAAKDVHPF